MHHAGRRSRDRVLLARCLLAPVVEVRGVAADTAIAEPERTVIDEELVGDELLASAIVTRDHAGDGLGAVVAVADPDADAIADAQELPPPGVLDLDLDRADRDQLTLLPGPREVVLGIAPQVSGEDGLEGLALQIAGRRIEIENPGPRRALLVVAVAGSQSDQQTGQI